MVKYPADWKQGKLKDFAIINPKSDLPFSFSNFAHGKHPVCLDKSA